MAGLLQGAVSTRGLARSVAHRLKYYIDVKRKEDSFDSSAVIRDESESSSLYMKDNAQVEHDFAEIKLEASLRAYVGSTKECNRKVQKSAGRQKDLEKLIKKMAQDYVPDKTYEGRGKHMKRQKRSPVTAAGLRATAAPFMPPEEVRRLISSASKLIVAATSEASPEGPGSPLGGVLSPEEKDVENIEHLGDGSAPCLPFTRSHTDDAETVQGNSEGCMVESVKKPLEKNGQKKSNRTKKEKHPEDIRRPIETSPGISSDAHKSEGGFSRRFPTPSHRGSLNVVFAIPYLPSGQNRVGRKSILRGRTPSARTSSVISEHRNKEKNVQRKKMPPCQQMDVPVGCIRQKSADRPTGAVASIRSCRSDQLLKTQPVLSSRNPPAVKGHNRKAYSAKSTVEAIRTASSTIKPSSSVVASESSHLKGQGNTTSNHLDQRSKVVKSSPSDQQKLKQGSKRHLEGQRVHFQKLPHKSIPGPTEWKHHSLDGWSVDDLSGPPSDQSQPIVVEGWCPELVKCLQEDQEEEPVLTDVNESSFLYQVCQGMDQEAPSSLTTNRSAKSDGHLEHKRTPNLFNRLFLLNEPGGSQATEDPAGTKHVSCDRQTAPSPPVTLGSCRCSEPLNDGASETLGEHGSGSPLLTTAVLEQWGNELSEEEFTISSASCSLSASTPEEKNGNANIDPKEEEQSTNFSTETLVQKILDLMRDESTTPPETFHQHHGNLSAPAEEDRTDKDCKNGAGQVVYFSQLPASI